MLYRPWIRHSCFSYIPPLRTPYGSANTLMHWLLNCLRRDHRQRLDVRRYSLLYIISVRCYFCLVMIRTRKSVFTVMTRDAYTPRMTSSQNCVPGMFLNFIIRADHPDN